MCGRYSIFTPPDELEERFDATFVEPFEPRYNAAPREELPVVTSEAPDEIRHLQWGLVPSWADDDGVGNDLINARAETLTEKPSFREAYEQRRCLVLADGFYEWTQIGGQTQPYRVTLPDERPFAMAGLWERWEPPQTQTSLGDFGGGGDPDADPDTLETFTIVTTEPNETVGRLHDRMSVILAPEEEDLWLSGEVSAVSSLLDPYPDEETTAYPVSTAVNDPTNDSPAVIEEVDPPA